MREMLMWTCSRSAANSIRLCSKCSVNNRMLSIRSRYFKEKYVRNAGCMFNKANAKQTTFWHSFGFASVLHSFFVFVYRYRHTISLHYLINTHFYKIIFEFCCPIEFILPSDLYTRWDLLGSITFDNRAQWWQGKLWKLFRQMDIFRIYLLLKWTNLERHIPKTNNRKDIVKNRKKNHEKWKKELWKNKKKMWKTNARNVFLAIGFWKMSFGICPFLVICQWSGYFNFQMYVLVSDPEEPPELRLFLGVFTVFINILEQNNDYSDTLDFRRGWSVGGLGFCFGGH